MHARASSKPSEQSFASDLKEWINKIILEDNLEYNDAKVELIIDKKKLDIMLYNKNNESILVIEVKRPSESPSDSGVKKQAYDYAVNFISEGLKYYATYNVNYLIIWDIVTNNRVDQFSITYVNTLEEYLRKKDEIISGFRRFLIWYEKFLGGEPPKPIDEGIIEIIHSFISGIVATTNLVNGQIDHYESDNEYRKLFELWLLDKGWEDPSGDKKRLEEYCIILSKQFLYIYINKILFYNVLKNKYYGDMPNLSLPSGLISSTFYTLLDTYFNIAIDTSKDYETVFKTNFIDHIPVPKNTLREMLKLTEYLNTLDYSDIGYDIIGKVFEKLIPLSERHTLGQYFTRSDVVDLIIGFCIKEQNSMILDPACGSGTFLIRAYYRLKYLNGKKDHKKLLNQLWGVDIDKFPAHLSTINLAIRDLTDKENYPNIIYDDFFNIPGPRSKIRIGIQSELTKWSQGEVRRPTSEIQGLDNSILEKEIPTMNAVIGNPPYTRQEEMGADIFGEGYKNNLAKIAKADFADFKISKRASIYTYFFPHGGKFLEPEKGRLGFVTLRSWLDVGYGRDLQHFFLNNFKIISIIESLEERWFPDAQMLPCIVILENSNNKLERENNYVKFVSLKKSLSEFIPIITDERDMTQEIYRWKKVDDLVNFIEKIHNNDDLVDIELIENNMKIYENDDLRIVNIKQENLIKDNKWSKYLTAPSAFFKILNKAKNFIIPLGEIADVDYAIKTGANEFFCFPNKFFKIKERKNEYEIIDKKDNKIKYHIEKEYIKKVMNKIRPHKSIGDIKTNSYILFINESKIRLKQSKKNVLNYIEYGEKKEHELRNKKYSGYNERPTCKSRNPWYYLGDYKPAPIITPSIVWGRFLAFYNDRNYFVTDCLQKITLKNIKYNKALCSILNSTLSALFFEFSGRYIENRDKTISNEMKIYELRKLPIIDPRKLNDVLLTKLEKALDNLMGCEVKILSEEINRKERKELDKILLMDIIGLNKKEMNELVVSTSKLYANRINRFKETLL